MTDRLIAVPPSIAPEGCWVVRNASGTVRIRLAIPDAEAWARNLVAGSAS